MANPTSRHSQSRRDKRRANWKLVAPGLSQCANCQEPKLPHRVCPSCGTYRGRKVLEIEEIV